MLAAPTRSGKGVGVVIPVLLDYQHNVVVLDIKQENFDLTSGYRQSLGQTVYKFNPFANVGLSCPHSTDSLTFSKNVRFNDSCVSSFAQ